MASRVYAGKHLPITLFQSVDGRFSRAGTRDLGFRGGHLAGELVADAGKRRLLLDRAAQLGLCDAQLELGLLARLHLAQGSEAQGLRHTVQGTGFGAQG